MNINKIGDYYIEIAKTLSHNSFTVLKTDLFNEIYLKPILPHISAKELYSIELSPVRVAKAKRMFKYVDITEGDVTKLPYEKRKFDLILDFSTMDHIEDYPKALDEYFRVLKDDGMVYIIVWLDSLKFKSKDTKHNALSKRDFIKELKKRFNIIHFRTILRRKYRKNISFMEFKLIKNIPENEDLK